MKRLLEWLYWNSANILSASRFLTPAVIFGPWEGSTEEKLWRIVLLAATDVFDGIVARKVGNFEGIGKLVDSCADKVLIFSALGYLFWEKIIDPRIIEVIILGEALPLSIACFGISLAWGKNPKRNFSQTVKTVLAHWKINALGKLTMVFYFSMAIFIFLSIIFPQNEIWSYLYLISFWGGLIFRVISIGYYIVDLNNWQKEYNTAL